MRRKSCPSDGRDGGGVEARRTRREVRGNGVVMADGRKRVRLQLLLHPLLLLVPLISADLLQKCIVRREGVVRRGNVSSSSASNRMS